MKISYCVTCSSETTTLEHLLSQISSVLGDDELIILQDKSHFIPFNKTYEIILKAVMNDNIPIENIYHFTHPLNNDYGQFKNEFIKKSTGDYIMAIDGDEMLPESLVGENLHALIENNPTIEAYAIPRINDFRGVTEEHAKQWGWRLTTSTTFNRPIVNFPDYQWRLFKNIPSIRFQRKLHEKIEGYKKYSFLPAE